jgi:hypothetical protein
MRNAGLIEDLVRVAKAPGGCTVCENLDFLSYVSSNCKTQSRRSQAMPFSTHHQVSKMPHVGI